MSSNERIISFSLAINEAIKQLMDRDPELLLLGQGVTSPWYVGNTANDLLDMFGPKRVIDTPVSENAMTGAAVGAAIVGMKSIVVHPRMDFMMYAMDPIINEAANWQYMSGGSSNVPIVIWGIINRGGEQAAQHSQAIQTFFAHTPGLKVVAPATPNDAKGLMVAAVNDPNPVIFVDDRWLYDQEGQVAEELYEVPIGQANIIRRGSQATIVASSYMVLLACQAAQELAEEDLDVEVLDLRTISPLDRNSLVASARKTGRVVVADGTWRSFGVSAEIMAVLMEEVFTDLAAPVARVTLPDLPAPASRTLEEAYYPKVAQIKKAVFRLMEYGR